jgi:hypothetical protein
MEPDLQIEPMDTETFFKTLEDQVEGAENGLCPRRENTESERSAFLQMWMKLTGRDPADYEP